MSEIIPFDFGNNIVRTHQDADGNPWFMAKDVCNVLEHSNSRKAVQDLDEDEKGVTISYTPGGNQEMTTVSESGLYALIFKSRKPEAKKFRKWITSEVIPALRKTGCYALSTQKEIPAGFDQHKELFPLITEWSILLRDKDIWEPQEVFHQSLMTMQFALGNDRETPLKALTATEVEYAKEYLNAQISILKGIKSPEELEAAERRSEAGRKAARARWDKTKALKGGK